MKIPKLPSFLKPKPRRLNAATAARRAEEVDEYGEEPQTRFSVALGVVAMLHVVAVGGIYAFNTIKSNRKAAETAVAQVAEKAAPAAGAVSSAGNAAAAKPVAVAGGPAKVESAPAKGQAVVRSSPPPVAAVPAASALAPAGSVRVHHVKAGETVAKLAAMYGVGVEEIEEANGARAVSILKPGQSVNIPRGKTPARKVEEAPKVAATAKVAGGGRTYVVAKGDNPVAIARKLGVRSEELLKLNGIDDPKKLKIGQTLQVPEKRK